jgi:hypothetical protein
MDRGQSRRTADRPCPVNYGNLKGLLRKELYRQFECGSLRQVVWSTEKISSVPAKSAHFPGEIELLLQNRTREVPLDIDVSGKIAIILPRGIDRLGLHPKFNAVTVFSNPSCSTSSSIYLGNIRKQKKILLKSSQTISRLNASFLGQDSGRARPDGLAVRPPTRRIWSVFTAKPSCRFDPVAFL